MIFNISYNFLYNKNDKEILKMILMNTKVYVISISFYLIIYMLISLLKNKIFINILSVIFITDLISLVINIMSNILPNEYSILNIKKWISKVNKDSPVNKPE
jgi:hypothetical protein